MGNDTLQNSGIYLMNTGRKLYICIGRDVRGDDLFINEGSGLQLRQASPNGDDPEELQALIALIDEIRYNSPISLPLHILYKPDRRSLASIDEREFMSFLVDDVPITVSTDPKQRK